MSLGSRSSTFISGLSVNNCKHFARDWPLVNVTQSKDVENPLAIDFSFLRSSNNSFSDYDIWGGQNVNSRNVSLPSFKVLLLVLKRTVLHPNRVWIGHLP